MCPGHARISRSSEEDVKELIVAAMILITIGIERLLNAFLAPSTAGTSLRMPVALACLVAGSALLVIGGYRRLRQRR